MKNLNSKGFGVIESLLMLAIVGVVGGAGYYVYQQQKDTKEGLDKTSNSEVVKQEQQTEEKSLPAGWTLYESKEQGFKFAHPKEWSIGEVRYTPPESLLNVSFKTSGYADRESVISGQETTKGAYIALNIAKINDSNIEKVNRGTLFNHLKENGSLNIVQNQIDGVDTYEYEINYEGDGPYQVQFIKNGKYFEFLFDGETDADETKSVEYHNFRKMIDTFEFL